MKAETEANQDLADFIFKKLYQEAITGAKPYSANIKENVKFYKGSQWFRKQPSYRSKSVTNFTSELIRSEVAILTDNTPSFHVRPASYTADVAVAGVLNKLLEHVLYQNKWKTKFHKWVKFTDIGGICYLHPYWDSEKCNGLGDINIGVEYPYQPDIGGVLRDPSGEDNYVIIEKKVTLAEIYRLYPDKADLVREEVESHTEMSDAKDKVPQMPVQSTDGSMAG
jgi:hypothetical protein